MMKIQTRKSKSTQYVIGGTIAVVVLGIWISLPLMSGSSLDASVSAENPFKSKVVDITTLGSDISSESGSAGSPINGAMINNPATSGEDVASSLFQSGSEEDKPADAAGASASASASADAVPGGVPSAPAPSASGAMPKLNAAGAIGAGNSNTMTTGGTHGQFFGSGNQKAEFAPVTAADIKKQLPTEKKSALLATLTGSAEKSQAAAKSGDLTGAQSGASAAFVGGTKTSAADLGGVAEGKTVEAGLQLGQTAQDLKKNDPSLDKTKVTPPSKPKDKTDESEEMKKQIQQMVIQMVLKLVLGIVFQGMGVPAVA